MDRGALWATVHQSHDWATSLSLLFQIDPNVCKGLGENWGRPGLSHVIQHGKSNALNMEVSKIAQLIKNPPAMRERPVWFLGWEDSPGEGIGYPLQYSWASLVAQLVKNPPTVWLGFHPWIGKIPWRRERLPILVFWPGEFHGLYSPWGHKELDMTEQISLSL